MSGLGRHVRSAAGESACREAALAVLVEHVARGHRAAIVTQRGSADPELEALLAAGWTFTGETEYVAGKRIRTLTRPEARRDPA